MTTTNLSATQIQTLLDLHGERNTAEFIRMTPQTGWLLPEDMGTMVEADARVAFLGLVEIFRRQTWDERGNGGTCHRNKFGFSKKHVTKGTLLAIKWLNGEELTADDVVDAVNIAKSILLSRAGTNRG
jgi:hypothetical protein